MMKRILSRWKLLLAILILVPVLLLAWAHWWISKSVTPEALVQRLEASLNCRAEIASATADMWSVPAKISIQGLRLVKRDETADNAKPLAGREKLDPKTASISLEQASLEVNLWSIFKKDISIHDLLVQNATIRSEKSEEGVGSLQTLLAKPAVVAGKPNPELSAAAPATSTEPHVTVAATKPFNIKDFPLASAIKGARLEHVRLDFKDMKTRQLVRFEDASLSLNDVSVNPGNLKASNHAELSLDGRFQVFAKRLAEQINMGVKLDSNFAPFNPQTGEFAAIPFAVTIQEGSSLQDLPALERISQKMKKWEKYGLKIQPLPARAVLLKTANVNMTYDAGKLDSKSDLVLFLDNYELEMKQGSWLNAGENTCDLKLQVTASKEVSEKALKDLLDSVKKKIGDSLAEPIFEKVTDLFKKQSLILADGRLSIPMGLTGALDKPEVEDLITPILENALLSAIIPGL